jgi:hypothetical protein
MKNANRPHKLLFAFVAALMLTSPLMVTASVEAQTQFQTLIIHPDGTVTPASAPIQQDGNKYTFTDNFYGTVKIQKKQRHT